MVGFGKTDSDSALAEFSWPDPSPSSAAQLAGQRLHWQPLDWRRAGIGPHPATDDTRGCALNA